MTYSEFKVESQQLNSLVNSISEKLNSYDWRDENVRMSNEFQALKAKYNKAFSNLRAFNSSVNKKFLRKLAQERRQAKIAKA